MTTEEKFANLQSVTTDAINTIAERVTELENRHDGLRGGVLDRLAKIEENKAVRTLSGAVAALEERVAEVEKAAEFWYASSGGADVSRLKVAIESQAAKIKELGGMIRERDAMLQKIRDVFSERGQC